MNYLMEINIPYEILTWSPQEHICQVPQFFVPSHAEKKYMRMGHFMHEKTEALF